MQLTLKRYWGEDLVDCTSKDSCCGGIPDLVNVNVYKFINACQELSNLINNRLHQSLELHWAFLFWSSNFDYIIAALLVSLFLSLTTFDLLHRKLIVDSIETLRLLILSASYEVKHQTLHQTLICLSWIHHSSHCSLQIIVQRVMTVINSRQYCDEILFNWQNVN